MSRPLRRGKPLRPRPALKDACPTGKRRYASALDAGLALGRASTNVARVSDKTEKRQYFCPSCKGWHLTSRA